MPIGNFVSRYTDKLLQYYNKIETTYIQLIYITNKINLRLNIIKTVNIRVHYLWNEAFDVKVFYGENEVEWGGIKKIVWFLE
jgi:hypothetical protein